MWELDSINGIYLELKPPHFPAVTLVFLGNFLEVIDLVFLRGESFSTLQISPGENKALCVCGAVLAELCHCTDKTQFKGAEQSY